MPIYIDPRKDKDLIRRAEGGSNGPQQTKTGAVDRRQRPPRQKPAQKVEREQGLMNAIVDYLRLRGCVAIRINSGAIPVEGEGGRRLIRLADKGTSDILCCYRGLFVAIETKIGSNTPTPAQEAFLADVRRAGGVAIVAYSIEDVERGLEKVCVS